MTFLFLYGPPGSGKSTLGRLVARALERPFVDLDERIVQDAGMAIPDIFAREGESGFRERERRALRHVLQEAAGTGAVVALGGGALLDPENRALVEAHGVVVCLEASRETLQARLAQVPQSRPLVPAADPQALAALLERRAAHYRSFPRRVNVDRGTPQDLTWAVLTEAGWFRLRAMGPGYDVRIRAGALGELAAYLTEALPEATAWALVSDEHVFAHYGPRALQALEGTGRPVVHQVLPPGEGTKNPAALQALWEAWLQAGLDRHSAALALGGGVIGDLAGFAAATFMRGIPWVNLPTSLLAMVDASIGGKTGIDLPQAKNAVGAFHPPRLVLIDPEVLGTLPREQWRYGMAEVVKHALLGDPVLWERLQGGWQAVQAEPEGVVRRAVAVKVRVVEEDPWERTGRRAWLNAGHTVAHALEAALGYALPHGAAVAIGLVVEAALAAALGLAEPWWPQAVARVLEGFDLPTRIPASLPREAFFQALAHDKKRRAGRVRFALPAAVGRVLTGITVPQDVLERVIDDYTKGGSGAKP